MPTKKNPFSNIEAKKAGTTKTKSITTAEVTDEIKAAVDRFVRNKAELKRLEADQAAIEEAIVGHVRPQQDEINYCGSFTKSLKVPGNEFEVTYVTMDKFSVPQDEDALKAVKTLVKGLYDDMFETKETLSLKEDVVKNKDGTLDKLATACQAAGINVAEYFDRGEKVIAKPDLDRKQYELKVEDLETFRSLVKQAKASLR